MSLNNKMYKAELAARKEAQRIEELKKEREEEAKREALRRMNRSTSGKDDGPQRIEWMYATPMQAASEDDYMTKAAEMEEKELKEAIAREKAALAAAPGALFVASKSVNQELEARTVAREDPMSIIMAKATEKLANPSKRLLVHAGTGANTLPLGPRTLMVPGAAVTKDARERERERSRSRSRER
ncbi:uncharacterized protein AMSG_11515, partial [Thecamonas trahens ATCC 50062]